MNRLKVLVLVSVVARLSIAAVDVGSIQEATPKRPASMAADLYGWGYSGAFTDIDGRKASPDPSKDDPIQINTQVILSLPAAALGKLAPTFLGEMVIAPNRGSFLQVQNPLVGLQGTLYEGGGFSYFARYGVGLGVTSASVRDGYLIQPKALNVFGYQFPNSKFKAELVLLPQVTFNSNGNSVFFVYWSPRLYYQMSPSWWLVTLFESSEEGTKTTPFFNLQQKPSNLGLGVRYTSANGKGLWVQPFLNVFPFAQVATTAHVGVFFGGPLL